ASALEDVAKRGCDDGTESRVQQSPGRMLPRRTTPEVRTGHQHRCIPIPRSVQDEIAVPPPVVEEKRTEAGPVDPLEELLGNDLVGVDVRPVERGENAGDAGKRFHSVELSNV